MPQSLDEQRDLMTKWFGSIDCAGPINFLLSRGWTEQGGCFFKPTPSYQPGIAELECLYFLCDEWDFGCDQPVLPLSISGAF